MLFTLCHYFSCVNSHKLTIYLFVFSFLLTGIGSDHVHLGAANKAGIAVTEVTFSNSISVAEHIVMSILAQVRNYLPSHEIAKGALCVIYS
jgi:lactate dehydrogenase-like 2-hydroxyacid dehydrogenase